MRSADQIGRNVRDWHDFQAEERARALRQFLAMCRSAREHGEPWVEWIDAGCPELTREQYQAQQTPGARGLQQALADVSA